MSLYKHFMHTEGHDIQYPTLAQIGKKMCAIHSLVFCYFKSFSSKETELIGSYKIGLI